VERQSLKTKTFDESVLWRGVGAGWKQLYGSFQNLGVSFEWHDFTTPAPFDWGKSFHPTSVEICLNLLGSGTVAHNGKCSEFVTRTGGFYCQGKAALQAQRTANEHHQFITIEYTPAFLKQHLRESTDALHPLIREVVMGKEVRSGIASAAPLSDRQQQLIASLRQPPVMRAAQFLWYQSKALELMMEFFFQPPKEQELFCSRQKAVARDRVNKVIEILSRNLVEPPSLEEIGRAVGCSHFYLSRTFTAEMGMTISQYLRKVRMEKAAELLKEGRFNVTEVAMEVGYSSVSHFSAAFHDAYGSCPGLYSLAPKHSVPKGSR
jgi:AraC-like DNA-binding protein